MKKTGLYILIVCLALVVIGLCLADPLRLRAVLQSTAERGGRGAIIASMGRIAGAANVAGPAGAGTRARRAGGDFGGGTRAAAVGWRALEAMREVKYLFTNAAGRWWVNLADEIDLVAGISGGSFTATAVPGE